MIKTQHRVVMQIMGGSDQQWGCGSSSAVLDALHGAAACIAGG